MLSSEGSGQKGLGGRQVRECCSLYIHGHTCQTSDCFFSFDSHVLNLIMAMWHETFAYFITAAYMIQICDI